jgi:hypothetical protein
VRASALGTIGRAVPIVIQPVAQVEIDSARSLVMMCQYENTATTRVSLASGIAERVMAGMPHAYNETPFYGIYR